MQNWKLLAFGGPWTLVEGEEVASKKNPKDLPMQKWGGSTLKLGKSDQVIMETYNTVYVLNAIYFSTHATSPYSHLQAEVR